MRPRPSQWSPASGRSTARSPFASPEWSVDRVRSLLLWLGAALPAASALTFTAVAWSHLGDGGRALLLIGVTTVSVGSALGLVRRLPATAEAFTALSIALAVIDWLALRRAGIAAGTSGTAWWAIGTLTVSTFAFALGRAVGRRTTRVAIALLVPLSLELVVATVAGAAWSGALLSSLIAGAIAPAWRWLQRRPEYAPARVVLMVHCITMWSLAVGLVATVRAHSLPQSLVPAAVILTLGLAPAALLRSATAPGNFEILATLVCAVVPGALVVAAATTIGPQGLLAWSAAVAAVVVVVAPSLPRRWILPAFIAASIFAAPGLVFGATAALSAITGPLAWLRDAWHGSLDAPARASFAGPRGTTVWRFGWPSVFALGASVVAIAGVATPRRGRDAFIPLTLAVGGVLGVAAMVACLVPVVAGASALTATATATTVLCALPVAAATVDRSRPELGVVLLPVAILPAIAATGWAALTSTASIVVLGVVCFAALFATVIAASEWMRAALGAFSGAVAITLAGVVTRASASGPATAGFAVVVAACVILLVGVHGRRRVFGGAALEVVGVRGLVVGTSIVARQTPWLAGALTVTVPVLLAAAARVDRRAVYSVAAGTAALGATWAWLAVAQVGVVEAYTAPAAVLALGVGLLQWRRGPARSWIALAPPIVLALGPTLVLGIARDDGVRNIVSAVMAFAIVGIGAWHPLQAPLVLGSVALLTLALDTFGPAVARLPRWLSLAIIGVLLMWIGATFEKRRDGARRATRALLDLG